MISLRGKPFALCCNFLFCLLTGCVSGETIITTVGTDVTLRCTYDARYYGKLAVCWGRGSVPNRGCANQVIKSDGTSVTSRLSERYLLLGNLGEGDVSLTIRQVEESDSGTYGCRVDIPGWFNDQKQELTLTVKAGRPFPVTVKAGEVNQRTITVRWNPPFDGGVPITDFIIDLKNKQEPWDSAVRSTLSHAQLIRATLVDLHPAKTYNVRMFAVNSVGMSESSNVLTFTTKEAAPEGPPLDMRLEALSSDTIRVTWKPPRADLTNGILLSYKVTYREYDADARKFKGWQAIIKKAMHEVESHILRNLKPSTEYAVLVQAMTNAGIGPASSAPLCSTLDEIHGTTTAAATTDFPSTTTLVWDTGLTFKTLPRIRTTSATETTFADIWWEQTTTRTSSVPPDPPVVELQELTDNIISLSWSPGFEGDGPITGYFLEYKAVNASWEYTKTVVDFGPDQTEATIIEITPSTYNLRMFAMSSLGISKASNVLTVTIGEPGQQINDTVSPVSADSQTAVTEDDGHGAHPAAIIVPVVLVVLIGAMATAWQLRRIKRKKGSLSMLLNDRGLRYKGSESLQEF
ncbi:cell adhesion molecule DSCAM-like [Cololabis saira]|uniref:cell adhesion molecule DSCAM-like n=1 Tax=Cololabis saira TaxID=129043 RepID=UPI002AD39BC6|nr:cell adhesion molecule DSCAM-like [Cololabis saira]